MRLHPHVLLVVWKTCSYIGTHWSSRMRLPMWLHRKALNVWHNPKLYCVYVYVCMFIYCIMSCSHFVSRFWFFKFAALVAITVGAFYIPDGPFTYSKNCTCGAFSYSVHDLAILYVESVEVTDWAVFLCCSMVCCGLRWSFLFHSDTAGAAGGLCPLLEWVLGGKDGDWELQGLVCRSVKLWHSYMLPS